MLYQDLIIPSFNRAFHVLTSCSEPAPYLFPRRQRLMKQVSCFYGHHWLNCSEQVTQAGPIRFCLLRIFNWDLETWRDTWTENWHTPEVGAQIRHTYLPKQKRSKAWRGQRMKQMCRESERKRENKREYLTLLTLQFLAPVCYDDYPFWSWVLQDISISF